MIIRLNKWQTQIVKDTSRFLCLNCGRRSGKSYFSALKLIFFAARNNESISYYVSPSYKQSKAIMWEMIKKLAPAGLIRKANESSLEFEMANGSKIMLKGADSEPDALRGVRIDYLVCDEVSSFRNWDVVWDKVLRPTLVDSKGKALFISTPQGHNFWFDFYNTQDPGFSSYSFSTYDNEYIDRAELAKLKLDMSEDDFRQEILAEFVTVAGQVYKEWSFKNQFVPLSYDPLLEVHLSFDFGVNDPTALVWFQRQGGEFRIIDHYEASNGDVDHFVQVIRSKPYRWPSLITGDPAGKARSITTNTSPIDEYARQGIYIRTIDGILIPEQVRITHKYMRSVYVDNKLQRVRDCILNYAYPKKKENIQNQSNEIPLHNEFSHTMRAIEYYFANIDSQRFYTDKTPRRYDVKRFNVA